MESNHTSIIIPSLNSPIIDHVVEAVAVQEGFGPQDAYRAFPFDDITVNGLVVNAADFEGELGLIAFYRAEVLHGPGAFLEIANGFADYERAMRRKLERELMPAVIGARPGPKDPKG